MNPFSFGLCVGLREAFASGDIAPTPAHPEVVDWKGLDPKAAVQRSGLGGVNWKPIIESRPRIAALEAELKRVRDQHSAALDRLDVCRGKLAKLRDAVWMQARALKRSVVAAQ